MAEKTLKEFCEDRTQQDVADLFGLTQGRISQMLRSGRDFRVNEKEDGTVEWFEVRRPRNTPKAA